MSEEYIGRWKQTHGGMDALADTTPPRQCKWHVTKGSEGEGARHLPLPFL